MHDTETFRGWKVMLLARGVLLVLSVRAMNSYDCQMKHNVLTVPGLLLMIVGLADVLRHVRTADARIEAAIANSRVGQLRKVDVMVEAAVEDPCRSTVPSGALAN